MIHRFMVGEFECTVLNVGHFFLDADTLMGSASPPARAAACAQYGLDAAQITLQMNPLLINTGQHQVLIDPGTSFDAPRSLMNALHEVAIHPDQITGVIITHGHADHYNGSIQADGSPAFPNAQYVVQRAEWGHWFADENPEPHHAKEFQTILGPLKEQIVFLEGDGEIMPGFEAILTPGHSPAHMAVLVNQRMICVADVLQHEVYIGHPTWTAAFDCWPQQVVSTRQALLQRIVTENLLVSTYHFTLPGIGHVMAEGDNYRWIPLTDG